MPKETFKPYEERTATVVGGRGALGKKVVEGFKPLGFQSVRICEAEDPFVDFLQTSTDIFFAVDDKEIKNMLQAGREHLTPDHSILDGSSVKAPLIPLYKELDSKQVSVVSTHLGAAPTQPWRGVKMWVCEVGPNSEKAKRLAFDLFTPSNLSIQTININDHVNVERDQFLTMATAYAMAAGLKELDMPLGKFDDFSTLNAELQALPIGRTLGQPTKIPSEVLIRQPLGREFIAALRNGLDTLEEAMGKDGTDDNERMSFLQNYMQGLVNFHNADDSVTNIYNKAGIIGARNANLRLHSLSFRITSDTPGTLSAILPAFYSEGANLNAIDSMPGTATQEELNRGVNPDGIVDFHIGIDPSTIDEDKERRIKENLQQLGCTV